MSICECEPVCVCACVRVGLGVGGFKPLEQCHPVDRALLRDSVLILSTGDSERSRGRLPVAFQMKCEQAWATGTCTQSAQTHKHAHTCKFCLFFPHIFFPPVFFFSRNDR